MRLISSETGGPGATAAQNLANKLGVEVMAPSDVVFAWPSGRLSVGPTDLIDNGTWVSFWPGRLP